MAHYGQTYLACVVLLGTRDRDSRLLESSPRPRFLGIRTLHVSMSYPSRQPHSKLTSGLSPFRRHHEKYSRGGTSNGRTALVLTGEWRHADPQKGLDLYASRRY